MFYYSVWEFFNRILPFTVLITFYWGLLMVKKEKGKKLTLEEARQMFSGGSPKPKKQYQRSKTNKPNFTHEKIDRRIQHLERRIMEGDLSSEEETQILKEIGQLEAKSQ